VRETSEILNWNLLITLDDGLDLSDYELVIRNETQEIEESFGVQHTVTALEVSMTN
ncbi:hypothetical protein A2U01_0064003, partial [Trifolium medium]|nr:hypothetical protein [Trifolium medium]